MERTVTGVGIGLRIELARGLLADDAAPVDFVEIHPENFVDRGGAHATMLERASARFPVLTHGLTLGFASAEAPRPQELVALRRLLDRVSAPFHSDHFCFTRAGGRLPHELLPPSFDAATVAIAVERIHRMQDAIGRPVAVENVSYYVPRAADPLAEIDALAEIVEKADAHLLLDVNNVVVNAHNHGFDPRDYLARVPFHRVAQLHVAGHLVRPDGLRIDTHGATCDAEVRALLADVLRRTGPVPVLLERDTEVPAWATLADELRELRSIYDASFMNREEPASARDSGIVDLRADPAPQPGEPGTPEALQDAVVVHVLRTQPAPLGEGLVAERWDLYRRMVRARLVDLLAGAFSRTRARLGEPGFLEASDAFFERSPSIPVFWRVAEAFAEDLLPRLEDAVALDLLRLELATWRIRQKPYASDAPVAPVDFEGVAVLAEARESFDASYPVHDAARSLESPSPSLLVVVRGADDAPSVLSLNPSARALYLRLAEGRESLTEATQAVVRDRALQLDAGFVDALAGMLAQWVEVGLLRGVRPRGSL